MLAKSTFKSLGQPASTMATSNSAPKVVHTESDEEPASFKKLPAELRLDIYRHYFSDLYSQKRSNRTVWSKETHTLSLLQTSSQVRREAAPIFYKEFIGNHNSDRAQAWVLSTSNLQEWLSRLKAMSQLLAQQSPDVEVSIRLTRDISTVKSNKLFSALRTRLGLRTHTRFGALHFANILCDYLARGLHGSSKRSHLHKAINQQVKCGWLPRCCFTETINGFLVAYNYSPDQREERLVLKGPLAKVDWSGLVLQAVPQTLSEGRFAKLRTLSVGRPCTTVELSHREHKNV